MFACTHIYTSCMVVDRRSIVVDRRFIYTYYIVVDPIASIVDLFRRRSSIYKSIYLSIVYTYIYIHIHMYIYICIYIYIYIPQTAISMTLI